MRRTAWLRCKSIRNSMFRDERIVVVERSNGTPAEYYVDQKHVNGDLVQVQVERERADVSCVTLPTADPLHSIFVRSELLSK